MFKKMFRNFFISDISAKLEYTNGHNLNACINDAWNIRKVSYRPTDYLQSSYRVTRLF